MHLKKNISHSREISYLFYSLSAFLTCWDLFLLRKEVKMNFPRNYTHLHNIFWSIGICTHKTGDGSIFVYEPHLRNKNISCAFLRVVYFIRMSTFNIATVNWRNKFCFTVFKQLCHWLLLDTSRFLHFIFTYVCSISEILLFFKRCFRKYYHLKKSVNSYRIRLDGVCKISNRPWVS